MINRSDSLRDFGRPAILGDKMSTQLKRLIGFLTAQLYKAPDDDQVKQFVLFHSKPGGVIGRQLDSFAPSELNKPDDIAKNIIFAAQNDADVYPLVQHYVVIAYRESDPGNGVGSLPFKLRPKSGDGDATASEPPTKDGITSQLMRHLETVQQNQAAWQQGVFSQVLKFVSLQSDELARHRQLSHETHEAREQLMLERVSVQHQANLRDLELAGDTDDTKKLIAETAAKYLPMAMPVLMQGVGQLVSGKKSAPLPEGESPAALPTPAFDIGAIIANMGDDEKRAVMTTIAQNLSPDEIRDLGALFAQLTEAQPEEKPTPKKARKKSARKKKSSPATSGGSSEAPSSGSEKDESGPTRT